MRNDWEKITSVAHTTPDEVKSHAESVLGSMNPLCTASADQLISQGNWLLTSLERQTSYPLHPDVPRVSDIIAWLSVQIAEVAKSFPLSTEKFEMQSLYYQLVKHPSKTHPKEHYQVRVDIEFATPSVALARAFHDRLVSTTSCIDTTAEVKWVPGNGKYRASFFLKDKTYYPPLEL
jgi:type IV pilus assembly protein PilM